MWKLSDLLSDGQRKQLRVKAPVAPRPPERPWLECPTGKMPYATRADAEVKLREICDMARVTDMRTYRCAFCARFHMGHRRGTT